MIMNGLALLVTVFLVVAGVWIADVMAKMRKDQDCVLSGRRGCTPVDVVPTALKICRAERDFAVAC